MNQGIVCKIIWVSLFICLVTAITVQAREGFYLGLGTAAQSVTGDLDGKKFFVAPSASVVILAGKMDSGTGFAMDVGYGINEYVAIELLYSLTSHTAEHEFLLDVDKSSNATLSSGLLAARFTLPVGESLELFGRVGLGGYIAEYEKFALFGFAAPPFFIIENQSTVEFSGGGIGYGLGLEYLFDPVGIEVGYTIHNADFDEADGGGVSGELPETLSTTISTLDVIVAYHF